MIKKKNSHLILTVAQTAILRKVYDFRHERITVASDYKKMEVIFVDSNNERINKKVMQILIQRQLVRLSYGFNRMITTKLGEKLAKLSIKQEKDRKNRKNATIVALGTTSNYRPKSNYTNIDNRVKLR